MSYNEKFSKTQKNTPFQWTSRKNIMGNPQVNHLQISYPDITWSNILACTITLRCKR